MSDDPGPQDDDPRTGAPTLYAVYLGGDPVPGRLSEDHEVVMVVAADLKSARRQARAKWAGTGRPHVDAVAALDVVDGYAVELRATGEADRLDVDLTYEPDDG
jgi:hypothetical protein